MKVLLLNTFGEYGGAAIAARRLKKAFSQSSIDVEFGVILKESDDAFIISSGLLNRIYSKLIFILERLLVKFSISKKSYLFKYSLGFWGQDITKHPAVRRADIVHIHWVNFGLLGIKGIERLASIKPLVWTLHDMWAFTGGCHYALDCENYKNECNDCFYLKKSSHLSSKILRQKYERWDKSKFHIITCSNWLKNRALESRLMKDFEITSIRNTLDVSCFIPQDKIQLRGKYSLSDGYYVLFGAMDHSDIRKGFSYLLKALSIVNKEINNLKLITFGKAIPELGNEYETINFGSVTQESKLAEIYNLADVFVLPSIQDNLPNTVLESLSCGTPAVAFDSGGVEDMIIHRKTGFLAINKNAQDLAKGIIYFYDKKKRESAGLAARNLVEEQFQPQKIAQEHIRFYKSIL